MQQSLRSPILWGFILEEPWSYQLFKKKKISKQNAWSLRLLQIIWIRWFKSICVKHVNLQFVRCDWLSEHTSSFVGSGENRALRPGIKPFALSPLQPFPPQPLRRRQYNKHKPANSCSGGNKVKGRPQDFHHRCVCIQSSGSSRGAKCLWSRSADHSVLEKRVFSWVLIKLALDTEVLYGHLYTRGKREGLSFCCGLKTSACYSITWPAGMGTIRMT